MRFTLILALVLALASVGLAQLFCPPNHCATFKCPELTEASCLARGDAGRYVFRPHGSACGCCASCVKILHEGEDCHRMMIMDAPASEICGEGLKCTMDVHHVCIKKPVV